MAGKPENLLLEYMRRFDARQARFEDALRDISARLPSIAGYLTTVHGDLARHRARSRPSSPASTASNAASTSPTRPPDGAYARKPRRTS